MCPLPPEIQIKPDKISKEYLCTDASAEFGIWLKHPKGRSGAYVCEHFSIKGKGTSLTLFGLDGYATCSTNLMDVLVVKIFHRLRTKVFDGLFQSAGY